MASQHKRLIEVKFITAKAARPHEPPFLFPNSFIRSARPQLRDC
jgi:hypothetical protein